MNVDNNFIRCAHQHRIFDIHLSCPVRGAFGGLSIGHKSEIYRQSDEMETSLHKRIPYEFHLNDEWHRLTE